MQCTTVLVCQQVSWHNSIPKTILKQYNLEYNHSESLHCPIFLCHHNNLVDSFFSALMREFKAQELLNCIHFRNHSVQAVEPSLCFHTVPYSSNLFHTFGKDRVFCVIKDFSTCSFNVVLCNMVLCVFFVFV